MANLEKLKNGVNTVADIASNFGVIGGVAGGAIKTITGLFGHKKSAEEQARENAKIQYEYQQKLNAQQQEYSQQNATTAYNRQRELTSDNPLLQKEGMRNAGMSTAFTDGSSVGAASSVDQASAPNAGSVSVPDIGALENAQQQVEQNNVGMMLNAASVLSQNKKSAAETENQKIKNMYEERQQIADLKQKAEETHNKELLNQAQSMENAWNKKYGERIKSSQADEAESRAVEADEQAAIASIIRRYKDQQEVADLANKRQQLLVMLEDVKLKRSERAKLRKEVEALDHQIMLFDSERKNVDEDTRGKRLNNDVLDDDTVKAARQFHYIVENLPKNMSEAIFQHPAYRAYMDAVNNGRRPTYREQTAFERLLTKYQLQEKTPIGVGNYLDILLPDIQPFE